MPIVTSSRQFNAWYAQQRRKFRLNAIAQAITKVFISLENTANMYYELSTPIAFAADFEIELDFESSSVGVTQNLTGAVSANRYELLFSSGNSLIVYDGSIDAVVLNIVGTPYLDGRLHTIKITRVGGLQSFFVDGVNVGSGTFAVGTATIDCFGSRERSTSFFDGIISDVKLTDITTPANSLAFELDNLTGNTEVDNGVTLTYQNISFTTDVRDTYVLSNGGTQWVSSLQTIDIAAQA